MKTTSPHPRGRAAAILAVAFGLTSLAQGASYQLNLYSESGNIGKYTFDPDAGLEAELGNYASVATSSAGSRFWTFCLERTEYFSSGGLYDAEISASASTTSGPDAISQGTAYLYEEFVLGNLSTLVAGLNYDAAGGTRIQNTIWSLEDEGGAGLDSALSTLLTNQFGSIANARLDYAGESVGVLNLTRGSGNSLSHHQDQLVYRGPQDIPPPPSVPDGGTTLLLLSLSLGGLGFANRKKKA